MAQFPLRMNGVEICTLDELRENFDFNILLSYRKRFATWLKGWDYDEEAAEVKILNSELTDDEWVIRVCSIIGISEQEIEISKEKKTEAEKLAQAESAAKQREELQRNLEKEKRKLERQRKRSLTPTPENIHITIHSKKSPFHDTVSQMYISETGIIVKTISGHLYFSDDCEKFTFITPKKNTSHYTSLGREDLFFCEKDLEILYYPPEGGIESYALETGNSVKWNDIVFFVKAKTVFQAWKNGYKKLSISNECPFIIKNFACFDGKVLIWGENNEFATGEIEVQ